VTSKKKKVKTKSEKLEGQNVTWTGYRDKEQEAIVQENGGQVVSFGSKTTVLLVSPSGKSSSKGDKARERGIPVMTWDEFKRKFKL
jgi:NAD-dependent DNA ligase